MIGVVGCEGGVGSGEEMLGWDKFVWRGGGSCGIIFVVWGILDC